MFGAIIGVGRLNPPTRGHAVLVRKMEELAKIHGAIPILYIVDGEKSSKDRNRNPLTGQQRLVIARKFFPGIKVDLVANAYEVLEILDLQGLKPKVWVAGSDRASKYRKLLESENITGEVFEIDREAGEADGVSATAAREAALKGDMIEFSHQMPVDADPQDLADIVQMIREVSNARSNSQFTNPDDRTG